MYEATIVIRTLMQVLSQKMLESVNATMSYHFPPHMKATMYYMKHYAVCKTK